MILKFSENSRRLETSASLPSEYVAPTPSFWQRMFIQRDW